MFTREYEIEVAAAAQFLFKNGQKTLAWSSEPLSEEMPWAESWADIYIEEICSLIDTNWLLTIVSPKDEAEEGHGYFKIPRDGEIVFEFADHSKEAATKKTLILPNQQPRNLEIEEESEIYWSFYKQDALRDQGSEVLTYRFPVWSRGLIEKTTCEWLYKISGCRFELELSREGISPLYLDATEALKELDRDRAIDLGDGIFSSPEVFDDLLQDPDQAAEIMREIKNLPKNN